MEGLTRLVTESLARHGFDRPLDYRRLHWSRWFRCNSHHSLLFVPSKPGVFAVAEEIMDLEPRNTHVAMAASAVPQSEASGPMWDRVSDPVRPSAARLDLASGSTAPVQIPNPNREAATQFSPALQRWEQPANEDQVPEGRHKRMLAVTQFFEDDDMAFVLDRMLSRQNPMCSRLTSGRYFVRFVVVEDQTQRRSICAALNQWIVSSAEKATGIGSHFASSLELTPATEYISQPNDAQQSLFADSSQAHVATAASAVPRSEASASITKLGSSADALSLTAPQLDSGAATNIHCPTPFPSGF